jgi:hypothetical protein
MGLGVAFGPQPRMAAERRIVHRHMDRLSVDRLSRRYSSVNLKRAGLVDHTEHYLQVFDG